MAELGTSYISIVPKLKGSMEKTMAKPMDKAGKESGKRFGGAFSKMSKATMVAGAAAAAAAGAAAVGAVADLAAKTAEYGDQVDKTSQKMGISAKSYQEWDAVLQHSGTSMQAMQPAFKKLATSAQNGGKATEDAFKSIGLSMKDVQSMSTEDLWSATISGLQGMEDGTKRTAVASQLLGRGATELGALMNTSQEDTQGMIKTVNDLGGVMSDKAVKDAAAYQDALQDMNTAVGSVARGAGTVFMPMFTSAMQGVTDFVQENGPHINAVIADIGGTLGEVATEASPMFEMLGNVVGAVMPIVVGIIKVAFMTIRDIFKAFAPVAKFVGGIFKGIGKFMTDPMNNAKKTIKGIIDTIKKWFSGFKLKLPDIKLPHFKVSPAGWQVGDLLKGKIPSLSVKWYAKAMDNPVMFTRPTIFGGAGGSLMGAGEAGAEVMMGRDTMLSMMREAVAQEFGVLVDRADRMVEMMERYYPASIAATERGMSVDGKRLAYAIAKPMDEALGQQYARRARGMA